uniref:Uncharacterized protein n=1 Tax=Trypanosoma congolense (strain IL3000) TaxID=1068625 RepID=G0UJU1_TRYCI|nr:conserved hypothetical protein [Trypanosoma congolense IL3000]
MHDATRTCDFDPFGVLDAPTQPCHHLTLGEYTKLVCQLGDKLGLDDGRHFFNLRASEKEEEEGEVEREAVGLAVGEDGTGCLAGPSNGIGGSCIDGIADCGLFHGSGEPLCVHLLREGASDAITYPKSLPSVVCKGAGDVPLGPPHVHCLFCLRDGESGGRDGGLGHRYVEAEDLRQSVRAHYVEHMAKRDAYLNIIEEAPVSINEMQVELLESAAEREGRHTCFIISAGSASNPVVVVYCAACEQMAPMATFLPRSREKSVLNGSSEYADVPQDLVSTETTELILARLLLACELSFRLQSEQGEVNGATSLRVQEELYIYTATPFPFGEKEEELAEAFEEGAILTHSSVVLPSATMVDTPSGPCLCLLEAEEDDMLQQFRDLPPYRVANAVVGFLMQWPTESATSDKLKWVLCQENNGLRLAVHRRLVYVEDTDEWVIAFVIHHPDIPSVSSFGSPGDRCYGSEIRVCRDFSIAKMVPVSLVDQLTLSVREDSTDVTGKERNSDVDMSVGVGDCPYSMESRTINYFAMMTIIAKAMCLATTYFNDK